MREAISQEVNEVINEFGPKLYDDFDSVGTRNTQLDIPSLVLFSSVSSFQLLHPLLQARPDCGDERLQLAALISKGYY